jgi:hypothetical protein
MLTVLVLAQLDVTNKLQQTICGHLNWNFWGPSFMASCFTKSKDKWLELGIFEDNFYKRTPTQRTALGKYPERSIGNFCTRILTFIKFSQISGTPESLRGHGKHNLPMCLIPSMCPLQSLLWWTGVEGHRWQFEKTSLFEQNRSCT